MRSVIANLVTLLLLTACSTTISSKAPDFYDRLIVPDIREYSPAEQDQAAMEMLSCTQCYMLKKMVNHYGVMRDQARVAKGISVPVSVVFKKYP